MTTDDTHRTEWSLRSGTICPKTPSRCSWKFTTRPCCCGASRATAPWSGPFGGRDRQRVHPAPGLRLRALARKRPLVEPGGDRADGCPVAAAPGLGGGAATGGFPASRPAPAAHAGAGLRLLAGTGSLGVCRAGTAHGLRAAALPRPGLQRLPRRQDLPRQPPLPRGSGTDTESFFSPSSPYRGYEGTVEETPRQPASLMGGTRWTG